jgi:hypothetical protein
MKPSRMNRLQRSMIKDRVSSVSKDSTINVSSFLQTTLQRVVAYLQDNARSSTTWQLEKQSMNAILRFWWQTYKLAVAADFDESTFQAHLAIGTEVLKHKIQTYAATSTTSTLLVQTLSQITSDFDTGFRLSTGLGMEKVWKHFRPLSASNATTLNILQEMEQLAVRFDKLRWRTSILPTELSAIMQGLVNAYRLLLTDGIGGQALIEALSEELTQLEASVGEEADTVVPYLTEEFEHLRQYHGLASYAITQARLDVTGNSLILSDFSIVTQMRQTATTPTSVALQCIDYILGNTSNILPLTDTFSTSMLHKLRHIGDVDLKSLRLLENELQIVGEEVVGSANVLVADQIEAADGMLKELTVALAATHDIDLDGLLQDDRQVLG